MPNSGAPASPGKRPEDLSSRLTTQYGKTHDPDVRDQNQAQTTDQLKTFVSTFCDRQAVDMGTMIRSSLDLFNYCCPSREAVLVFYSELFAEYSTYYWILRKRSTAPASQSSCSSADNKAQPNKGKIEYVGELTRRFYQVAKMKMVDECEDMGSDVEINSPMTLSPTKSIPISNLTGPDSPTGSIQASTSPTGKSSVPPVGPRVIPVSRRTSSSNSMSDNAGQNPSSPPSHDVAMDNVAEPDEDFHQDDETTAVDIFSELEDLINEISTSLITLTAKHLDTSSWTHSKIQNDKLRIIISDWATELLVSLNAKHSQVSMQVAAELNKISPTSLLSRQIDLCMANPVNKLLVDLLLESRSDFKCLFGRMMSSAQNCDWLLAYILLGMSKRPNCDQDFASSMEFMIGSQSNINSLTYILAYLSDNNPKAMTNFPKSNIPFLISLCQSSISLLNVLASEIPDQISPSFLNNLAKEVYGRANNKGHPTCIESLTHCVIAAPNTYKLLLLAFDVVLSDEVTQDVKSAAQIVIDSVVLRIHERATQGLLPQSNLMPNPHLHLIDGLLNQINNDVPKLIQKLSKSQYVNKKASAIFFRMSLIFGPTFASKVICYYLNLPEESFWPLLKPILFQFMKNFGDDGSTLVSQTLSIDRNRRKPAYWVNMNTLAGKCPDLKLDLDLISHLLSDKLCAATFDLNSTSQLIKLCCNSLERVDQARIRIGTRHRLCKALATCYFILLENETDDFPEVLSYIKISLTCMFLLKQSTVASHILCRALLERSLVYGHLFNKDFNPALISDGMKSNVWTCEEASVRLSNENLKVSVGHRFRRLPYHERTLSSTLPQKALKKPCYHTNGTSDRPYAGEKPDRKAINSYLLVEAFRSSINNIESFANLFVEFHCPVMFDKHLWPSDEALRVINERNLAILRKFEQVSPFWDLFEFIGENKCLHNCLVLVKALLAAHLAIWASATKSCPEKLGSTSRLIPPLSRSGLIPQAFGLTVEVFKHLSPSEVFSVLSDIWQYVKDTNSANGQRMSELTPEEERAKSKAYMNRLRLFMCQHMPGSTYVRIFKEFYKPAPKTIPT